MVGFAGLCVWLGLASASVPGRADEGLSWTERTVHWAAGSRVLRAPSFAGAPIHGVSETWVVDPKGELVRVVHHGPDALAPLADHGRVELHGLRARLAAAGLRGRGTLTPRRAWWATEAGLRPIFEVSALGEAQDYRIWLDGETGEVLRMFPTRRWLSGPAYPTNPLGSDPVTVELDGTEDGVLEGRYVITQTCDEALISSSIFGVNRCLEASQHAVAEGGSFDVAPAPELLDDPFAEVNVHHHLTEVSALFENRFGLRRPQTKVYVNFEMTNAFYGDFDGDGVADLAFGQSPEGIDFAYDADVVVHEAGHGFVDSLASLPTLRADDLGMDWVGGSVNEGVADWVALALFPDGQVGEYAGGDRGAIRDLRVAKRCPDDVDGEVHADGEILGAVVQALIEAPEVGADRSLELLIGAVTTWGPDLTWELAGQSLVDAAAELAGVGFLSEAGRQAVDTVVAEANLLDCGRLVQVQTGRAYRRFLLHGGLVGELQRLPGETQFELVVPQDATAVEIVVDEVRLRDEADGGYTVFARWGAPVEHAPTNLDALGLGFSVPVTWDQKWDGAGDRRVRLDDFGPNPLRRGETLYVSLASYNRGPLDLESFGFDRVQVRFEVDRGEPAAACGCATSGPVGALGLGPLLLLWARRRRR